MLVDTCTYGTFLMIFKFNYIKFKVFIRSKNIGESGFFFFILFRYYRNVQSLFEGGTGLFFLPGLALLALQALDEGRLLAADVGPGPAVHKHVEVIARPAGVVAQETLLVGLHHGNITTIRRV